MVVMLPLAGVVGGVVAVVVHEAARGRRPGPGALLCRVGPRVPMLAVAGVVLWFGIAAGLVVLVVPGCMLLAGWAVVLPAVAVEGRGPTAFMRSWSLVAGRAVPVFWCAGGAMLAGIALFFAGIYLPTLPLRGVVAFGVPLVLVATVAAVLHEDLTAA